MKTKAIGTLVAILVLLTLVALPVWAGDSKGLDADAARYQAMGAFYLATSEAASSERDRGWEEARDAAMSAFYLATSEAASSERGRGWEEARDAAMGAFYQQAAAERGIEAAAARYTAMGAYYQAAAERGIDASAARYAAMGAFFLAMAGEDDGLAANPELRVARAWTAQNTQSLGACVRANEARLGMAANPELALVSRVAGC